MKTVGIIGGLGPDTSADFYLELITRSRRRNKLHRPPILLWNVPIPYKVEEELILKGQGEKRYLPFLIEAAKRLEKGGANFIVIPCNTVHIFIKELRESVTIPVLSIVEETVNVLKEKGIKRIGFLSTELTIKKHVYSSLFHKHNITPVLPTTMQQGVISRLIQNILSEGSAKEDSKKIKSIIENLIEKRADAIVLACTDLQHIVDQQPNIRIFDTMNILADATIKEMLSDNS